MAIDRLITNVGETASQSGASTYSLAGVIDTSYQTFAASALADTESTYVRIDSVDSDKWEILEAQYDAGNGDLTRVSTVESSNADAAVDFGTESLQVVASVTPGGSKAIGSAEIRDGAVTAAKIGASAVGTSELDLSITPTWTGVHRWEVAASTSAVVVRQSGDTDPRISMRPGSAGGVLEFGSGSAAVDVTLFRNGADELRTTDSLIVDQQVKIGANASPSYPLDVDGTGAFRQSGTGVGFNGIRIEDDGQSWAWRKGGDDSLRLRELSATNDVIVAEATANHFALRFAGSNTRIEQVFQVDPGGYVGINESANANQTVGLTINQGAADDEILALKSSDVAHGVTAFTEADTYGGVKKSFGGAGGVNLFGVRDSGSAASVILTGVAAAVDTTKSTSGNAVVEVSAQMTNGAGGTQDVTADGNLFCISQRGVTTRFIFDAEGSAHADVEWTTYDEHDDVALIRDLEATLVPNAFGEVVAHDRAFFERTGLLHDVREVGDGRMRGMLNQTKMLMLHSGAIRQVADTASTAVEIVEELMAENPDLTLGPKARALLN